MAIARDNSSYVENAFGTNINLSHTISGSNCVLTVGFSYDVAGDPTSVTYAGVAMTLVNSVTHSGNKKMRTYIIVNPTSGSNNINVQFPASTTVSINGQSYSGAKQTGQPDSNNISTGTGTSASTSSTVVATNCWAVMFVTNFAGGSTSSSTNWTKINGFASACAGDSNGTVSTGSLTQACALGASGPWIAGQVVIAPYVAVGPANLKSYNTNVAANIKSINTNPIANVKSLNTNV